MSETTETGLTTTTGPANVSMFLNENRFAFAQRIGQMLATSTMVPDHFRNNIGNCLIALNLSERLNMDVFGLMQTSYIVHGRPGFEAKLLIAIFNAQTKLFIPPLRWETKGNDPKDKDYACRAFAIDKATGEPLCGEWITADIVKAEGWLDKPGSKWKTIPGQMYRYRSAAFFINVYEPGLKLGISTVDELEDSIIDVTPKAPDLTQSLTEGPKPNAYAIKTLPTQQQQVPVDKQKEVEKEPPAPAPASQPEQVEQKSAGAAGSTAPIADLKAIFEALKAERKTPEYKKQVIDNKDSIMVMNSEMYNFLKGKWNNKTSDPWPIAEAGTKKDESNIGRAHMIDCPNTNAERPRSDCETCETRQGCPAHE